ncbi:MAG TPA: hypothetical protein VLT59_14810, partial [Steroidobacteraceae bacterium]|nr:hypothetical protein [Steroidobacteraceae bacterium]
GAEVTSILKCCAPTWLAELWQIEPAVELDRLREQTCGATTTQLWRELDDALAALTRDVPLVLCIDDAQWVDAATSAWVDSFAQGSVSARVLLIAISRDGSDKSHDDAPAAAASPTVLKVSPLERSAVAAFLRKQFAKETTTGEAFEDLVDMASDQCRGEPVLLEEFATRLAEAAPAAWRSRSGSGNATARRIALPRTVRDLLRHRLACLDDDSLRLLESAAIVGRRFTSAELAAACEQPVATVEQTLTSLTGCVSRGPRLTWPDGTMTTMFGFRDERCCKALIDAVPLPRRALIHGRVVRRLEAGYGDRAVELACDLAPHCEHAGDLARAVTYLRHAGGIARRRSAPAIAARHYRRALVLIEGLPASPDRNVSEAQLQLALGRELAALHGPGTGEVAACYGRAMALEADIDSIPSRCSVLWGLWVYHVSCGPLATARALADQHLALARAHGEPALLLESYHAQWSTGLMMGDVHAVLENARLGMAVCGSRSDYSLLEMTSGCMLHDVHLSNHHAAICAGFFSAWADALLGRDE